MVRDGVGRVRCLVLSSNAGRPEALGGAENCATNPHRPTAERTRTTGEYGAQPRFRGAENCATSHRRSAAEWIRAGGGVGAQPPPSPARGRRRGGGDSARSASPPPQAPLPP